MKKNFLLYTVLFSVVLHLLLAVAAWYIPYNKAKVEQKKAPLIVDILGPLEKGPETKLPKAAERPIDTRRAAKRQEGEKLPQVTAKAVPEPRAARPPLPQAPAVRPAPSPREPVQRQEHARTAPPAPAQGADTYPEKAAGPADSFARLTPQDAAPPGRAGGEAGTGEPDSSGPRRMVMPTIEDLIRYADIDPAQKKQKKEESITLDTDDLMYTSYLQGLKRRIETIWEYPETARRDGVQGHLVMKFSIEKSGRVRDIEVVQSSGYPMLDRAAEKALMDANPFNPLPDNWNRDQFTITGTFVYRLYGMYLR